MTHQELEAKLVDYLYEELATDERAAFEEGLKEHPTLAEEVHAHTQTRSSMAVLRQAEPPQRVLDSIMRQARAEVPKPETRSWLERTFNFLLQPAVATAMIFLLVASASLMLSDEPLEDETRVGQQPLAVATDNAGGTSPAPEERVPVALAAKTESPVPRSSEAVASALPVELAKAEPVAEASEEKVNVRVAAAPRPAARAARARATSGRSKASPQNIQKFKKGLESVSVQLAEKKESLIPRAPLAEEAPLALGMLGGGDSEPLKPSALAKPRPAYGAEQPSKKIDPSQVEPKKAGNALLRKVRRLVKQGRYQRAGAELKKLAALPGFAKVAESERKRLTTLRKTQSKKARPTKGKAKAVPAYKGK
jgi:hypothetical protein